MMQVTETQKRARSKGALECVTLLSLPGTNSNSNLRKLTATQHSWAGHGTFVFYLCVKERKAFRKGVRKGLK